MLVPLSDAEADTRTSPGFRIADGTMKPQGFGGRIASWYESSMSVNPAWRVRLDLQPAYPSPAVKAAVLVLLGAGGGPLTYRGISGPAIDGGFWSHDGATPVNTMARDIREDITRAAAANVPSLFSISDSRPVQVSLVLAGARQVALESDFAEVRAVHELLLRLDARVFEELVSELVWRMGFKDVVLTSYSGDGGVDVTASFPCGPISEQRFVFQAKRWQRQVGQGVVRELRGVLADDEQGVLIATAGLTGPARRLAQRWRRPIVLIEGQQLAELLIDHGLGLQRLATMLTTASPRTHPLASLASP